MAAGACMLDVGPAAPVNGSWVSFTNASTLPAHRAEKKEGGCHTHTEDVAACMCQRAREHICCSHIHCTRLLLQVTLADLAGRLLRTHAQYAAST